MHSLVKESLQKSTWLPSVHGKMKYLHHLCRRLETYLRYGTAEEGTMSQTIFASSGSTVHFFLKLFNLTELNLFVLYEFKTG